MRLFLLLPLALGACVSSAPPQTAEPAVSPESRLVAECALLARAAEMMAAAGTPAQGALTEGCPGDTSRDTRPLARQTASLREAGAAPLPPGVIAGTRAEAVFRRMITRGVPPSLALHLTSDPLYAEAVR